MSAFEVMWVLWTREEDWAVCSASRIIFLTVDTDDFSHLEGGVECWVPVIEIKSDKKSMGRGGLKCGL